MKARVSNLTAIFFAVFGFTCWVLGDSCIKWIGQYGLPPEEIVAFMGVFMALTLALQALVRGNVSNLRPRSVVRQVLRALLDMTNNICVVFALRHLSLTTFYILVFTSPMVISVLAAVFLGEHMTPRKTVALLLGFSGVVVAVAPWSHVQKIDIIGLVSCLVCVACFSVNMIWSRVLTRTETPESLAFCSGLVTAIAGLALTSFHPRPLSPSLWLALGMMGVFCAAGTLSFYVAVKHTSASNVSQYHYTHLVTGALISYLVWHDKPGLPVLAGGSLIIGAGLIIAVLRATLSQPYFLTSPFGKASPPGPWILWIWIHSCQTAIRRIPRIDTRGEHGSEVVVHRLLQILLATEVPLGGQCQGMTQKRTVFAPVHFHSRGKALPGTGPLMFPVRTWKCAIAILRESKSINADIRRSRY